MTTIILGLGLAFLGLYLLSEEPSTTKGLGLLAFLVKIMSAFLLSVMFPENWYKRTLLHFFRLYKKFYKVFHIKYNNQGSKLPTIVNSLPEEQKKYLCDLRKQWRKRGDDESKVQAKTYHFWVRHCWGNSWYKAGKYIRGFWLYRTYYVKPH